MGPGGGSTVAVVRQRVAEGSLPLKSSCAGSSALLLSWRGSQILQGLCSGSNEGKTVRGLMTSE
jgi:hypothetical protein